MTTCRLCGCTDLEACPGGCSWVPDPELGDLCSSCIELYWHFEDLRYALLALMPAGQARVVEQFTTALQRLLRCPVCGGEVDDDEGFAGPCEICGLGTHYDCGEHTAEGEVWLCRIDADRMRAEVGGRP